MRNGKALSIAQSAQSATVETSAKSLFFLPNPIPVNEVFICQKISPISNPRRGMRRVPGLSEMNTRGYVVH